MSRDKLDAILVDLVELILQRVEQAESFDTGKLVAAAVVTAKYPPFMMTSKPGRHKTIHAERNAVSQFKAYYNLTKLPTNTIIVTTLSPCTEDMADRVGVSCSEFLEQEGVSRIYCGCKDKTHAGGDFAYTKNKALERICERIAATFIHKLDRENDK